MENLTHTLRISWVCVCVMWDYKRWLLRTWHTLKNILSVRLCDVWLGARISWHTWEYLECVYVLCVTIVLMQIAWELDTHWRISWVCVCVMCDLTHNLRISWVCVCLMCDYSAEAWELDTHLGHAWVCVCVMCDLSVCMCDVWLDTHLRHAWEYLREPLEKFRGIQRVRRLLASSAYGVATVSRID